MIMRWVARRSGAGAWLVGCFLATAPPGAAAAEPAAHAPSTAATPFFVKSAASLAELEKTLEGKGAHGAALLNPGRSALEIVWRHEEDFEQKDVELHDRKDHVFFVTDGQATLTLGGKLVAPREVSPGEWKAEAAVGSQTVDVQKGDLVFIPSGTVHGRSARGRRFTMLQLSFWPRGLAPPRPVVPAALPGAPASPASPASLVPAARVVPAARPAPAARVAPGAGPAAPTTPPPKGSRP